jgi:hypothetical protein
MMLYYTKVLVLQLYQIILWNTGTPQPDVIEKDLFRIYSPHRQVGPVTSLLPHPQFLWRHGGQIHIVLVWSKLSTRSSSSSPPTSTAVASIRRHYREVDRSGFPVPRLSCLLRAFLEEICGHQKKKFYGALVDLTATRATKVSLFSLTSLDISLFISYIMILLCSWWQKLVYDVWFVEIAPTKFCFFPQVFCFRPIVTGFCYFMFLPPSCSWILDLQKLAMVLCTSYKIFW